jgi:hypothetical protein
MFKANSAKKTINEWENFRAFSILLSVADLAKFLIFFG